ncbi:unnamed protein product [Oikopleura dioica]|uniref:Troponin T n=1 Tax=Oikopleura dioica TaxID=34765 RepID=E4YI59_OIKDI|nr:unnamed protein product [Oikopleura dioica]
MEGGDDFFKKRLEKDLAELKKMIDSHFVQREKDEEELATLEQKIAERKEVLTTKRFHKPNKPFQMREQQNAERARKNQERREPLQKEAEEARRLEEEARKKKEAMDKLNKLNSGQPRQRKGKGTARDVKKKILADRRKPLNIDHMDLDKLKQKVTELYDYLSTLENERADFETDNEEKKYETSTLRLRVNMLSGAASKEKTKRIGRIGVKK